MGVSYAQPTTASYLPSAPSMVAMPSAQSMVALQSAPSMVAQPMQFYPGAQAGYSSTASVGMPTTTASTAPEGASAQMQQMPPTAPPTNTKPMASGKKMGAKGKAT